MHQYRTSIRSLLRLSGLAAAATAGLIGLSTAASASGPTSPVISELPNAGAAAMGPQTVSGTYDCDTSVLRVSQTGPALGSLDISTTMSAPVSGVAGQAAHVTFVTQVTSLSPAITAVFPAVDSLTFAATAPVNSTAGPGVALAGQSGPVAANATQLPSITATGVLQLTAAGPMTVTGPGEIKLALTKGGKVLATLDCDGNDGSLKIGVSAPPPPTPVPPTGPEYTCALSANVPAAGSLPVTSGPFPFQASVTGPRTTGSTDILSVGPDLGGASIGSAIGGTPTGIAGTAFAASVPVTGAGHGSVLVRGSTKAFTGQIFTGSGRLYLANPGTYHVLAPKWFTFTIDGPKLPLAGKVIKVTVVLRCTLTGHSDPVLTRLTVTGKAVPAPGTASQGGGTAANGAVPAGAPNTGGGPRPGTDVALAAGGAALLLAGAGGLMFALRRRRLGQPSV